MAKKIFYATLSVCFFAILVVGMVMVTNLLFNGTSSFFDRMSDVPKIFSGVGA